MEILARLALGVGFAAVLFFGVGDGSPQSAKSERGVSVRSRAFPARLWGRYNALIIGINSYHEWTALRTAANDARALKEILVRQYGFSNDRVIHRTDHHAILSQMTADLRDMAGGLGRDDNLLIYFAGHGQLDDLTGEGYWIPVEGKLKDPSTWLSHSTVRSILSSDRVGGKNIIVVADSCYAGALLRGGPSLLSMTDKHYQEKLRELSAKKSRQVITSGGNEPVADGGREGHSLFGYYFLRALRENNREIVDLENLFLSKVWKPVAEIGGQRPNIGRLKTPMDEDGQFVLVHWGPAKDDARTAMGKRRPPYEKTFTNSFGMEFVFVPAGKFIMGSPSHERGREADEGPQHEVEITASFFIGKYEVTQRQWQAVMGGNPSYFKNCGDDCPVENVSWYDVQEFLRKINQMEGAEKYRLPTEAEWEYACRAGSQSAFGFGDHHKEIGEYAWCGGLNKLMTSPVGQKRPNSWGLYDMHGNVWEWCSDGMDYNYYGKSAKRDPAGPVDGFRRVFRGGSWNYGPLNARCAFRASDVPSDKHRDRGFRLVRAID